MDGWLVAWLVSQSLGGVLDWSVSRLVSRLVGWFCQMVGGSVGWSVSQLVGLVGCLVGRWYI